MRRLKELISIILAVSFVFAVNGCVEKSEVKARTIIRFAFWEPGLGNGLEEAVKKVKLSYEKIHPETEVEIITQPVNSYQEWLKAQLAINDAPEIIANHAVLLNDLYVAGYITDLDKEYMQITPYSNGEIWKGTFKEECVARAHSSSSGSMYAIPLFDAGLAVYYNKDIYEKLNLNVPETWNEYIENCKIIKDAGIIPIAMPGQGDTKIGWIVRQVIVGLCGQRILADENINFNGDCITSDNEIVKAIDTGYFNFTTNEEYRGLYRDCVEMVKEYLEYCTDAEKYDEMASKMLFVSGEAAHIYSGSWDLREIMLNNNSDFNIGIFPFPMITKENGKWAGPGICYNVTQPVALTKTESPEKKAAAVDFLQYLTSKDVYESFIADAFEVPVLKDIETDPIFNGFISKEGYPENSIFQFNSSRYAINTQQAFVGLISEPEMEITDDMFKKFQESMEARAEELKKSYGWSEENDYKISELVMVGGKFEPIEISKGG